MITSKQIEDTIAELNKELANIGRINMGNQKSIETERAGELGGKVVVAFIQANELLVLYKYYTGLNQK